MLNNSCCFTLDAGYLQPVIDVLNRRFDDTTTLQQATLASLGISQGSCRLQLSFKYVAPPVSEEETRQVIADFQARMMQQMVRPTKSSSQNTRAHSSFYERCASRIRAFCASFVGVVAQSQTATVEEIESDDDSVASSPPVLVIGENTRLWVPSIISGQYQELPFCVLLLLPLLISLTL